MRSMYLITGATGGLGKAFAVECASRGWDLFLTDLSEDSLAMLAPPLERTYGVTVSYRSMDLTNAASRAALFGSIREQGLKFRGLLNVAGLDHEGFFMDRRSDEITTIIRLNIESALMMTHGILPLRDHSAPFRIINVSSLGAYFAMPIKATYAASKRFLLDFSLALRNELRDENVTVTVLCPAGLPTTQGCIEAIDAQGLMGQLTTENIGAVAHQTVESALHGRATVIPGPLNKVLLHLSGLVPSTSIAEIVGRRWRLAHLRRTTG
jgi:short-subunit dehydrogenase